jgi:catechol 2,3-dioxygenase
VADLKAAEQFYCGLLGLKIQERVGDSFIFLTFGEAHHDLALQQIVSNAPIAAYTTSSAMVGLYHSAFEVASAREFLDIVEKLKAKSVPYSLIDHGISWAAYTADPSGNGVEIYIDRRTTPGGSRLWDGKSGRLSEKTVKAAAESS